MKRLWTFDLAERAIAGMYREMLKREGIDCLVRNDGLSAGLGEIPFLECLPELWVVDDELYPRAVNLLKQFMAGGDENRPAWICRQCGERVEGQFNACWNCGTPASKD